MVNISNLELIGKNIIIVEDDPSSSRYYEALLISTGADFKIFHTGKEFVDYLKTRSHQQSLAEGKRVTVSSLVINALEEKYGTFTCPRNLVEK